MEKLSNEELKELARWFHTESATPMFQRWQQLMKYNLSQRDREIRNQEEGLTAWKRGYAACLEQVIESPQQLITEFVKGDTTDTPVADEEK